MKQRLLRLGQAARYLGLTVPQFRALSISSIELAGETRFDRLTLDAHVDEMAPGRPSDDPEEALDRFLASAAGKRAVPETVLLRGKTKP